MTNIIPFDPNKNSKKTPQENKPDRGRWTEHFDEEAARCFGTYIEWDDIAVMHLAEQIMNYMYASGWDYNRYSMLAAGLVLKSYKEENCEVVIREFLVDLKYLERWNSCNQEGKAGDVTKALTEICDILYEKYPDL